MELDDWVDTNPMRRPVLARMQINSKPLFLSAPSSHSCGTCGSREKMSGEVFARAIISDKNQTLSLIIGGCAHLAFTPERQ
jgi:hypothetical protein